ncbi:MAG: ABC transporter substrate-binding protein [Alphaproteobacteria bacterium]
MKVKIFFIVITIFLLPFNLMAKETSKQWLETKGRYLIETFGEKDIAKKHQKLDELLTQDVDLAYIARFVIGKYYRDMNETQKQRYMASFKNYALYTYKQFPLDFGDSINFKVDNVVENKNLINAQVLISISPESVFDVEFVLRTVDDNYKIVDIKVGESSFLIAYRSRFYEMIADADGEIDWFIEDLEALAKKK